MTKLADYQNLLPETNLGRKVAYAFMGLFIGSGLGGMAAIDSVNANYPSHADRLVARNAMTALNKLAALPQPQPLGSIHNPVARFIASECQAQFANVANHQHINICIINKAEEFGRTVYKPLQAKPVGQGATVAKGVAAGGAAGAALALLVPMALRRRKPEALSARA